MLGFLGFLGFLGLAEEAIKKHKCTISDDCAWEKHSQSVTLEFSLLEQLLAPGSLKPAIVSAFLVGPRSSNPNHAG